MCYGMRYTRCMVSLFFFFFSLIIVGESNNHAAFPGSFVAQYPHMVPGICPLQLYINMVQDQVGNRNVVSHVSTQNAIQKPVQTQTVTNNGMLSSLETAGASAQHFFTTYKYWLIGGVLGGVYGYVCYTLYRGNEYLARRKLWSSWKNSVELEILLSIPQKELAQELVREIQRRYANPQNPTDFISPFALFLTALEQERRDIEYYAAFGSWIRRLYIATIVPFNGYNSDTALKRIERLAYLKNVFLTWAADFKIAQVQVEQ